MNEKNYAILDTDFVSKSNIIMNDDEHVLADLVLEFPEYSFSCHEMMVEELNRHGTRMSQSWFQNKIANGVIEKYASLAALLNDSVEKQDFLNELKKCDDEIGVHQSLGEKKAYVLLQALRFIKGDNVFLFCSDDFGARSAMAHVASIPCISVVAVFMKLKNMGVLKSDAAPYFQSYIEWCNRHKQTQIYVWKINGAKRRVKRDLQDVFDGLYKNEFSLMLNGANARNTE